MTPRDLDACGNVYSPETDGLFPFDFHLKLFKDDENEHMFY